VPWCRRDATRCHAGGVSHLSAAASWWDRVSDVTQAPDLSLVLLTGLLALAATAVPELWRRSRHLVTIVHEGAHGLAALVSGRRLGGIRLHADTSGLTTSSGSPRGLGRVATTAAGYVGPGLAGLGSAALLTRGHAVAVLWLLLVLLVLMVLQVRNLFGLWVLLVAGAGVWVLTRWVPVEGQLLASYLVTWMLLLGAPRAVVELHRDRRDRGDRANDADALARLTHLPGLAWVGFFLAGTVGCLVVGGRLLVTGG
jgi:Peptidase M50B-like